MFVLQWHFFLRFGLELSQQHLKGIYEKGLSRPVAFRCAFVRWLLHSFYELGSIHHEHPIPGIFGKVCTPSSAQRDGQG